LPVAYSVGFNPHMRLSFGPALGVGIASEAEYVDVEMSQAVDGQQFSRSLSEKLPPGLALVAAQPVSSTASLAAELNLAAYQVRIDGLAGAVQIAAAEAAVKQLQLSESVTYLRRSPKGIKTMDLKSYLVGELEIEAAAESFAVRFWLRMTPGGAVKPQEVMRALVEQFGFPTGDTTYCRMALRAETNAGRKTAFEI
jgi:radical SAM-linked protein